MGFTVLAVKPALHCAAKPVMIKGASGPTPHRHFATSAVGNHAWWQGLEFVLPKAEPFHDQFNGEGYEYSMQDVENFHEQQVAKMRRQPDQSQHNGEGPDWEMRDAELLAEELAKDRAVRRK